MNALNMSIREKRQTIEYINTQLKNDDLSEERISELLAYKNRLESSIRSSLNQIKK